MPIEPAHVALMGDARARPSGTHRPISPRRTSRRGIRGGDPHGALEHVRLAAAEHGQQERVLGRVLDPLRRLRRGVRRHQGRVQAAGLRAVPPPQPPRRSGGRPRVGAHQAAVGRAAARPARRPEPPALRGARPDPRRSTWRGDLAAEDIVAAGHDPAISSTASSGWSTWPSTSGASPRRVRG